MTRINTIPFFICGSIGSNTKELSLYLAKKHKYKTLDFLSLYKKLNNKEEQDIQLIELVDKSLKENKNKLIIYNCNVFTVVNAFKHPELVKAPVYYWVDQEKDKRFANFIKTEGCTQHLFNKTTAENQKLGEKEIKAFCKEYKELIEKKEIYWL